MPRGPYHERFRQIAEESDNSRFHLMVQCRVLLMDRGYHTDDCILSTVPSHRRNGIMCRESNTTQKRKQLFVMIGNVKLPIYEGTIIEHLPVVEEEVDNIEVKRRTIYSEPMYLPILDTSNFNEEVWRKSPKYVKRMYNATFVKKIHLYGHIWLPFVKKVGPVIELDERCQYLDYPLRDN